MYVWGISFCTPIIVRNREWMTKRLYWDACQTHYSPRPGASSVAYRLQSELSQFCGLCRSHTFTYAKNLIELPHILTYSAVPSRLHRRILSTRLYPKYQLPKITPCCNIMRLIIETIRYKRVEASVSRGSTIYCRSVGRCSLLLLLLFISLYFAVWR